MRRHVILTGAVIGLLSGCGASTPTARTLQTAQRATQLSLEIGSCVRVVVERKLDPERTTGAIAACVDDAVTRDLAEQEALAELTYGGSDGEETTAE